MKTFKMLLLIVVLVIVAFILIKSADCLGQSLSSSASETLINWLC